MNDFLPHDGWKGYGSPNHPYTRIYNPAARQILREYMRKRDDERHDLREIAFGQWQRKEGALVNASVPLWIAACGMRP